MAEKGENLALRAGMWFLYTDGIKSKLFMDGTLCYQYQLKIRIGEGGAVMTAQLGIHRRADRSRIFLDLWPYVIDINFRVYITT